MSTMFSGHSSRFLFAGCLGLLMLCLAAPVGAQEDATKPATGSVAGTGQIKGRILQSDGKTPVVGAVVYAYHLESEQMFLSRPSDSKGNYLLTELPHGYMDLAVEGPAGVFVGSQVVNVPPAGKVAITFMLTSYDEQPAEWWAEREPQQMPGLDKPAAGLAQVRVRAAGRDFWRSPKGIAVIAGGGGAALLAIASGGGSSASPFMP